MPVISRERCRNWKVSSALEWLETNGTGGFSMGTVSGANTRRYHGLLVASLHPPVKRTVLLSRLEEELTVGGETCNLGAAQYPGVIAPAGFQFLEEFRLDPFPTWTFQNGLTKTLFLVQGEQTAVIQYRASERCALRVRPLLANRDYHSLQRAGAWLETPLRLHHNGALHGGPDWYYHQEYQVELERGLDFREDLYSPGQIEFHLNAGDCAYVVATTNDGPPPNMEKIHAWEQAERQRRALFHHPLDAAASQFLVARMDGSPTLIAGYPWFTDWGRDTMICLPGLLLSRGMQREAEQILEGFLAHLNQGLIPNRFPDAGDTPEYNTVDATLWMFPAVWALPDFAPRFYPRALEILSWHRRGTHYGIAVDPEDGLLRAGTAETQLTWMDAKVGDWVVTPRHGKPVEINALWYNALRMVARWAQRFGDNGQAEFLDGEADRVAASFEAAYWNPERGCLYDCLTPAGPDARVRPNQVFALSLPFPLLTRYQRFAVLQAIEAHLLTPFGLRTLAPGDREYRGRYRGGPRERDGAYHQGSVWPWLLGPYIAARLEVRGRTPENLLYCRGALEKLQGEMERVCLGNLPEIYDGDPPHHPGGTPAQAWSVAELLRGLELIATIPSRKG